MVTELLISYAEHELLQIFGKWVNGLKPPVQPEAPRKPTNFEVGYAMARARLERAKGN